MPKQSSLFLYFLIAVTFILVGCGADIDRRVTFYRDEAWKAEMEISVPGELVAMLGSLESFEADLARQVAGWEAKGADVSWRSSRKDTTLIYTFDIEGTGLALLDEIVFDNDASFSVQEVDGRRHISFTYFVTGDLLQANNNTLTLHGGDIVSSNGNQLDSGTVQWVNARGQLQAVVTEKSRFGASTFLIGLILVAGVGGAGWYFWQQRNQVQANGQLAQTAFCANCGMPLTAQAKFCPHCGHQQS